VTVIQVKVKPNSRLSVLERTEDGTWLARLKSPPADGKANQELIALIAGHFNVAKAQVSIKRGTAARIKWVEIASGQAR
jgi:uncharacterized protein (TIGR00251 family)